MLKILRELWNKDKSYSLIASYNQEDIDKYNQKTLTVLSLLLGLLLLIPVGASPFVSGLAKIFPIYLTISIIYMLISFLVRYTSLKKYALILLYISASIFFCLGIYLSIVHTPFMRATVLLGVFVVVPVSIIDRPSRVNFFVSFWFVVHTILTLNIKPEHAADDIINSLCFVFIGCYLGNMMIWSKVEGYNSRRLLTIEKETDDLTGLNNRRKLFETLVLFETTECEKPTGVLMIDIDNFKMFNDTYGHATGDECMSRIGKVFSKFSHNFKLDFYRYGGEEFVALAYLYNKQDLLSIAESIRISVNSIYINGHNVTVSIGVAHCGDEKVTNYENIIDRADKAVYVAKNSGRNKVCEYNENT